MICPQCGTEFRDGFDMCSDCHIPLIPKMDWPKDEHKKGGKMVCVLETGDLAKITVAKALLDGADIPYIAKNEGVQDIFGLGRLGTGYNILAGPVQILVDESDAIGARAVLEDLDDPS